MGYYINPKDMTKKEFLEQHGTPSTLEEVLSWNYSGDRWPVCLVKNHGFDAAGICFNEGEADAFNQPDDYRPKQWFMVPRDLLKPHCNRA